ncbi:site-specific DNA-methyltransferase [Candidatus Peregrinibacteria bacterium CG11_big_fil_rev_8_21_14_0_20_46_8]|nr:MAG: site-specific DNA-methyltransferase [Candidatus Peregrinibacteria bacterium CG11_big_fil_rev_8_21_14_0_20_46_8]
MASFHFKGKTFLQNYHHAVKFHNLAAQKSKGLSKSPSLDDNLVIHGDNLKALKALLPTHAGKVKCIYIDPPYNTGNEGWAYNDNVASPMIQEWLGKVVARDDLTRHDKWACMMYPRLTLLRELLQDDGVIFISIDDNEVHHLRMLMDEIFGEENLLQELVWKRHSGGGNDSRYFAQDHEYVLGYAKNKLNIPSLRLSLNEDEKKQYVGKDEHFKTLGPYKTKSFRRMRENDPRPGLQYEIDAPDGTKIANEWKWEKNNFLRAFADKKIIIRKDKKGKWQVEYKIYLNDGENERTKVPRSLLLKEERNSDGKTQLEEIFQKDNIFNNPKPIGLMKHFLKFSSDTDSLILDSFAGSGTTGHAVLALNKEDGGNRKFILIECEDYADKITAERMRRIIKGVPTASNEELKAGLGGTFSYYELGEELNMDNLLAGKKLPSYEDLAKYAFFTATGEKFDPKKLDEKTFYIGSSSTFEVFLMYSADKSKLKKLALNLEFAEQIHKKFPARPKLVFAPACFIEDYHLKEFNIRFAQLPFEIYRMAE